MIDHNKLLDGISSILSSRIVPLYLPTGRERLSPVGTGFMVVFNNKNYLITAAHVVQGEVGASDEFLPIIAFLDGNTPTEIKTFVITQKDLNTGIDEIDIAVARISDLVGMPPYKNVEKEAFSVEQLHQLFIPRDIHHYAIAGYPETKNKIKYGTNSVQARPYIYSNNSASPSLYSNKKIDQRRNILINFKENGGQGNVEKDFKFPKLVGMSGGPIVSYGPHPSIENQIWFAVVGVTQSHLIHDGLIKGTDIGFAKQLIVNYDNAIEMKNIRHK